MTGAFGGATVKVVYGTADLAGVDFDQFGVSVDYVIDRTTLTGFYRTVDVAAADADFYGVGIAYDLGGGASLVAGVEDDDVETQWDAGIELSF